MLFEKLNRVVRSTLSLNRKAEYLKIVSGLKKNDNYKLLDVGSGDGYWTKKLSYEFEEVVGLDPSSSLQSYAKKYFNNTNINYVSGYANKIPFEDNYFDGVLSVSCFEHFEDPEQCMTEMFRVLKPGGSLSISVDSLLDSNSSKNFRLWHSKKHYVVSYYSESEIIKLIEDNNGLVDKKNITHIFNSGFCAFLRKIYIKWTKILFLFFPIFYLAVKIFDKFFKSNHGQIVVLSALKKV